MKIFLVISAAFLVLITLLPLLRSDRWWVRIFDFPRSQILACSILVGAGYYWYWDPSSTWENLSLLLFAGAMLYQTYMVFPYTPLSRYQVLGTKRVDSESSISLLVANILMYNRNSDLFLGLVWKEDPDIIAVLEPDLWWEHTLAPVEKEYPYTVKVPLDNTYGMLLYSRLPLVNPEVRYMVDDDIPSIHTLVRLPSGDMVELHCMHPKPPHPLYGESTAFRDAELLILGKEVRKTKLPVIVVGDLNDVAWSDTTMLFKKISRLLDPRIGRGLYNTFHAGFPLFRWPLDHIFHSKHFKLQQLKRLPSIESDHFPVYIRLNLEAIAEIQHEVPKAKAEDHREAQEKISRAEQIEDFNS